MTKQDLEQSMRLLFSGVRHFQDAVFPRKKQLFKTLAKTQAPKILFITCSDSRIDPHLITHTNPGEMFVIQNAGNIVPPAGSVDEGTIASIDYAVTVLGVEHIVICGHSDCGAMSALLTSELLSGLPQVKSWLLFAEAARAIMEAKSVGLELEEKKAYCIQANIEVQLRHLKTLPGVAAKLAQQQIMLHGWLYQIESGEVQVYSEAGECFIPFTEVYPVLSAVH